MDNTRQNLMQTKRNLIDKKVKCQQVDIKNHSAGIWKAQVSTISGRMGDVLEIPLVTVDVTLKAVSCPCLYWEEIGKPCEHAMTDFGSRS